MKIAAIIHSNSGTNPVSSPSFLRISAILSAVFLFGGCSIKKMALNTGVGFMDKGIEAIFEEKDPQFAEDSLAGQLKLLEILQKNDPANPKLLTYLSQGFGAYAFLFIEPKDADRAKGFYARGRDYGLTALNKRLGLDLRKESDQTKVISALGKLGKADAPLLFWTAYSWGGLAAISLDDPDTLAQLPKIEKMMARAQDIQPGFFYAGPEIFLGSYYGSRPKIFGGDLNKSRAFFDKVIRANPKFLMARVMMAKYYAIPAQDEAQYREQLGQVLDFNLDQFPEQRLSNALAQRRAKKLLEDIHENF